MPQSEDENSEYADYAVSFSEKEDYELFKCKEIYNINLTEHYLYCLLSDSVENENIEYANGKKFYDIICSNAIIICFSFPLYFEWFLLKVNTIVAK